MGVHDGHRERLKYRFLAEGMDGFEPHMALELLLFYGVPYKDTNALGHELIGRFGSIAGVFDASVEELVQVKGVGLHVATLLTMMPQLFRQYAMSRNQDVCLNSVEKAGAFLMDFYIGKREEEVVLVCLDAKCQMLNTTVLHKGSVNAAAVSIRKMTAKALASNAVAVILAHNHPGGVALPSPEDISTTKRVAQALKANEIIFTDHIIVADNDFVSLAETGILS